MPLISDASTDKQKFSNDNQEQLNRIHPRSPMQIEKSQHQGWTYNARNEFLALSVDPRPDWLFSFPIIGKIKVCNNISVISFKFYY